ncbi:MAG: hypothetical protein QXU79_00090 [Candidatus Micrarchaeaceae archaeon]
MKTAEITVGGKKVRMVDPGVRAVLRAQEDCLMPNGQLSLSRYVEYIGQRWCEPPLTLDDFANEDEVVEFLRTWVEFRRPATVGSIRAEPPTVPVGQKATIWLAPDRKVEVVNPGLRWILQTQEACTMPNGQMSWLRYVEAILRDCTVGQPKLDAVFVHEDEVVEFVRLFRLLRTGTSTVSAGAEGS